MSSNKEKKKKSLVGRLLKYLGIAILVLIVSVILIPIFFKDQIKELALVEANKMLNATVKVGDFDLTMISTFPKMRLEFENVSITGKGEFEGVKLIDLKSFQAKLDFWSVISMEDISIQSVKLIEPNIHVIVLPSGKANYDIMKSDEEMAAEKIDTSESNFKFALEYYEIKDGNIIYDDRSSDMYAEIKNMNHSGTGDLTADVIDFETMTTMEELTFTMDGVSYLSKVNTKLDMNLLMEFSEESSKFTLKDNKLSLNALDLSFDGFYEMLEDYDKMDIKLLASNTSFKDLLSLIPVVYSTGYEHMIAKGSMSLEAYVKGKMKGDILPAWKVGLKVNNASITYPDMPANINNIQIVAGSAFPGGTNLDKMTIDVDQLKASFVGNTIDADFHMRHPMTDPFMKAKLNASVDLATVKQVYPMGEQELNGKLKSNIYFEGRMSALEKEEYNKIKAEGTLNLKGFNYQSSALPAPLNIADLLFEFSPQQLKLTNLSATMGNSDFTMSGDVENYMAYLFKEEDLMGTFNYHSNILDIDQIMPPSAEEAPSTGETKNTETADSTTVATGKEEPILVPEHINFVLNTSIGKVIYDGMDIQNVKGKIILKNQVANLENLSMNTLGGAVQLSGEYNTQNHQMPKMRFSYSLKELDIQKLAKNFLTVRKLAPIAKYVKGSISSDFTMNGKLKPSLDPIYNSLNGEGSFFSSKIEIEGFEPLEKLAAVTKIKELGKQTLHNVKAHFTFKDGKVKVKPFTIKMGDINTKVSGTTSLNQDINYKLKMEIPKDKIPSKVLDFAEEAIAKVKNIPFFKMNELPNKIPVTAFITNTITNPKVKVNLKEKLLELGGDIKGNVKDLIEDKVDKVKDTLKKVVDKKIDEAKEEAKKELQKRKKQILDLAQEQADNVKKEAHKLAVKTSKKADETAQNLIDEAGNNFLKKKAAEAGAKKIREEGDEAAQKIEKEAEKQADNIMAKAQEKANSLTLEDFINK